MKKLVFLGSAIISFLAPIQALAANGIINIEPPKQGFATIGNAISNLFNIALVVAILIVLVMLIIGAYEWITSGGDKEAVAKARNRIINALIGLVILAIAFALARLAGQVAGFPNIFELTIPAPNPSASGF